jgi:hypothetical protein
MGVDLSENCLSDWRRATEAAADGPVWPGRLACIVVDDQGDEFVITEAWDNAHSYATTPMWRVSRNPAISGNSI